jgi:hypothetical protein
LNPAYTIHDKKALLLSIRRHHEHYRHIVFMAGDWNFVSSGESRYDPSTLTELPTDHHIAEFFDDNFHDFTEHYQGDYTRKQTRHNTLSTLSRLDRIYSNVPTAILLEYRPDTFITHLLTDPRLPSDHCPVLSRFRAPATSPPPRPRIPQWVTDHPQFEEYFRTALLDGNTELDALNSMDDFRDALYTAMQNIQDKTALVDPTLAHERLHWHLCFLRASLVNHRPGIDRAIRRCTSLAELRQQDHHQHLHDPRLHSRITELANKSIDDALQEIQADQLTSEWKKVAKKEALRRRAAVWAPRRKTLRNMVILKGDGLPAEDSAAAAALLHQHWKPTFTAKQIDKDACDILLSHTMTVPDDITWRLDSNSFSVMLLLTPNSAPGPDGISYVPSMAGDLAHEYLFRC